MSNSYIPIPSSSDNEEDSTPMSEDENSESPRRYPYVPILTNPDTDIEESEEDPEEDTTNNSWEDNRTLPPSSAPLYSFEVAASPRQTARIRVGTPERVTLSSDNIISTPDRHQMNTENSLSWEQTLKTLRKWRDIGLGRSQYEQGETSEQREPLLDTTPIIVDRMLSHENRMDLLEDVIIHIPEPEAYDAIEDHLTQSGEEIMGLKREVQQLTVKLKSTDLKVQHMDKQMEKLIWEANQAEMMRITNSDQERYTMEREQKKDGN